MDKNISELIKRIERLENRRFYQQDFAPGVVKQRAIDGIVIFRGDVADRPSTGDETVQAYFAEDESKLYIWNTTNDAWESTSLT